MQNNCNQIEEENKTVRGEMNTIQEKSGTGATLEGIQLVIKRFPFAILKVFQYLHSVQMTVLNIKEDINANAVKETSREQIFGMKFSGRFNFPKTT